MHRTVVGAAVSAAFACGLVAVSVAPAAATLSLKPDKTWTTNGTVYSVVRSGNTIYLGGVFTQVSACKPTKVCPTPPVEVSDVAALDATTGVAIATFHPQVAGTGAIVYALAVLGNDLFIGGQFETVDGVAHRNLAAVDLSTGVLDANVDSQVGFDNSDRIRSMVSTATQVYVSGPFGQIDGLYRKHLAAFDYSGSLDPVWTPSTYGSTHSLSP